MEKKYGALSSSVNPQELSLTISAAVKAALSLAVLLGYVSSSDMNTALEQVPALVMAGYTVWQGLESVWGFVRRLMVRVYNK